jgi:hypothetical protein
MPLQSTRHIIMMEPVGFHSNPETVETNTYQSPDPDDTGKVNAAAAREFRGLRDALVSHGVFVTTFLGTAESPDDIFCNNWVSTHPRDDGTAGMVLYPMLAQNRRIERRPEIMHWLSGRYDVILDLSAEELQGRYLESTGSLALDRVNKRAYCALSSRSDETLAQAWCDAMGFELITFNTRNHVGKPVYHTDVVMFVGTGLMGVCADCIVPDDVDRVLGRMRETHRVMTLTMDQLRSFCGNALEVRGADFGGAVGPHGFDATYDLQTTDTRAVPRPAPEISGYDKTTIKSQVSSGLQGQTIGVGSIERRYLALSSAAYSALSPDQKDLIAMYFDGGVITSPIPTIERYGGGSVRCMLLEG